MTITALHQLPANLCRISQKLKRVTAYFPMRISDHMLSLIQSADDPVARQFLPDASELEEIGQEPDPLNEASQSPVPQIIHRYPGRVILLVSDQCAAYCRFCMRKRRLHVNRQIAPDAIQQGIDYIKQNKSVNEVILSGGDPFMLTDTALINILSALRRIRHIRILRIHTRVPSSWPQRITPETAKALSAFHPIFINIHFNHPDEFCPETGTACALLADAGIPLGSQTVLLRGINDHPTTLLRLFQGLLEIRVRPYYLHQLDRVPGTARFHVSLESSLKILERLRKTLSGQGMPHFMVDLPGGGGKVELLSDPCLAKDDRQLTFRNFKGCKYTYPLI